MRHILHKKIRTMKVLNKKQRLKLIKLIPQGTTLNKVKRTQTPSNPKNLDNQILKMV